MGKCKLCFHYQMGEFGEFNTIRLKDGREIDYTHMYTNGQCPSNGLKKEMKLVYEGDCDFKIVYRGGFANGYV